MNWEGLSGRTIGPVHDRSFALKRDTAPRGLPVTPFLFPFSFLCWACESARQESFSLLVILLDIFPMF